MGQITKQIKGKIIFKHETEADWKLSSYVPDEGEQIIYDPDASHSNPRIKIGDGKRIADKLPFTTAEIPTKISEFENDVGYLKTEADPTVPVWAKAATKPSYTAAEVGALPDTTVIPTVPTNVSAFTNDVGYLTEHQSLEGLATEAYVQAQVATIPTPDVPGQIGEHNVSTSAHSDIRLLIEGLTSRLNTLANSDDTTLDQMAELVEYIKDNRELIEGVTTNKVNVSDIINDLTTNVTNKPLSAAQGVALKALIDAINVPTKVSQLTNDSGFITAADAPDEIYVGDGDMPEDATIQIIMDGSDEEQVLKDGLKEYIDYEIIQKTPKVTQEAGESESLVMSQKAVTDAINDTKDDVVQSILEELQGLPVFGIVDENNTITVTSQLSSGTYTLMYENADGTLEAIGTITVSNGEVVAYTNLVDTTLTTDTTITTSSIGWLPNVRINSSNVVVTADGNHITNIIPVGNKNVLRIKNMDLYGGYGRIYLYKGTTFVYSIKPANNSDIFTAIGNEYSEVTIAKLQESLSANVSGKTFDSVRIGGTLIGTKEDVIVTLDEEIV